MAEDKNLPLPDKDLPTPRQELPPPHDMQLPAGTKNSTTKAPTQSFWGKYGSKKWLLPLIVFIIVLIVAVGIAAAMGLSNNPMTRREKRLERQEKRQERQERKQKKDNKNKKQRNSNKNRKSTAGSATFTYGSGANKITMQYQSDMKTNISEGMSILGENSVPLITLSGDKAVTQMTIEPNANNLSAASWQANLSKNNTIYNTPTETVTVSGKPAVMQHTLSKTANWIAYIPMSSKMLVVNMNYAGGKNKAKDDFTAMLKTLQIGETSITIMPTTPVTTVTP
jgi:flagellar basal body-associated protein FliL